MFVEDTVIRIMPFVPLTVRFHYLNNQHVQCLKTEKDGCPLCDHYSHLWRMVELFTWHDPSTKHELSIAARALKPIQKYFYHVVEQGEDKIKLFPVGNTLHEIITRGICDAIPPKLSLFERFWRWLLRKPKSWDALDLDSGYDFVIRKIMTHNYPNYSTSGWQKVHKPAGTKAQIKAWRKQQPLQLEGVKRSSEELQQMVENYVSI